MQNLKTSPERKEKEGQFVRGEDDDQLDWHELGGDE